MYSNHQFHSRQPADFRCSNQSCRMPVQAAVKNPDVFVWNSAGTILSFNWFQFVLGRLLTAMALEGVSGKSEASFPVPAVKLKLRLSDCITGIWYVWFCREHHYSSRINVEKAACWRTAGMALSSAGQEGLAASKGLKHTVHFRTGYARSERQMS